MKNMIEPLRSLIESDELLSTTANILVQKTSRPDFYFDGVVIEGFDELELKRKFKSKTTFEFRRYSNTKEGFNDCSFFDVFENDTLVEKIRVIETSQYGTNQKFYKFLDIRDPISSLDEELEWLRIKLLTTQGIYDQKSGRDFGFDLSKLLDFFWSRIKELL